MLQFKKHYTIKIISIIVSVVFLFTSTTYGIDLSKESSLRVPLNTEQVKERFNGAVDELSQKTESLKTNRDAIAEETIPRKDWVVALVKLAFRRLPGIIFFGMIVPIMVGFFELGHYLFNPFHPERKAFRNFIIVISLMSTILFTPPTIGHTRYAEFDYHQQEELIEDMPKDLISARGLIDNASTAKSLAQEGINNWKWTGKGKIYTNGVTEIVGIDTKILYYNKDVVMSFNPSIDYMHVTVKGLDGALIAIKISKDKEIIKISGNYSKEKIAVLLEDMENLPLYNEIKEALNLPKVTKDMKDRVKGDLQKRQVKENSIREFINKTLPQLEEHNVRRKIRSLPFDYVDVPQRHVGYVMRGSSSERILTHGAGPCVILTLYDNETGMGALTHLDAVSEVAEGVGWMLNTFREVDVKAENIEARIIGGLEGESEELVYDIYVALENNKISVVETDVLAHYGSKAVIFDAKDGKVYDLLGIPPEPKDFDIIMLMIQSDRSGKLYLVSNPKDLVEDKGKDVKSGENEKDDSKETKDPRVIEILNSAVKPIDMVNDFLKGGSDIIIFGESHTEYKHRIVVKDIIDSLKKGDINYLALELDTWRQETLDSILKKLEKKDEKLEREIKDELYKLIESQFWGVAYAKDAINAYIDMILSAYKKGIKIACIDPREHHGMGRDKGGDGYVIIDGERKAVDEGMTDNILNLKGKVLVLVGAQHAMNNFFIKYTGNKLPSLGSIIKKRVPSATIILQHAVQENPEYQVEIDSLISSLKLGESIGVPNLSNSPISNMSIGYFYKDVLFGKSGDAIILHPLESLKEPEDSIEKDTMPSPIKLKLHQKPKETETGL